MLWDCYEDFLILFNVIGSIVGDLEFSLKDSSMASKNREIIKLKSTESSDMYWTIKNKKKTTGRLELKKYDRKLRKHVIFKEAK